MKKVGIILLSTLLAAGFVFTSCENEVKEEFVFGDQYARYASGDVFKDQNKIGTHDGYDFELWRDKGTVSMTLRNGGNFEATWKDIGNILARKGKKFDSTKTHNQLGQITIDYTAEFTPGGNSYLCVYGWSKDPLIEYYIVESYGTYKPTGTSKGTYNGYDLYETTRTNQPSIEGTKTFKQYWAVRQSKRTSGTIDVTAIFNAWYDKGMSLGKMYEVALTAEGYQSSGSAKITKHELKIGGSSSSSGSGSGTNTNTNTTNNNNSGTTSTPSSGSETKVTFTGLSQASKSSTVTSASVGSNGALNLTFNGQWAEVKYNLSSNLNLANCGSIVVSGYSPDKNIAVKFYDASGNEAFVMYDLKGTINATKSLSATEKGKTIKTIGVMSQVTGNFQANINSVTFKGASASTSTNTNTNTNTNNNTNNNTSSGTTTNKVTFNDMTFSSNSGTSYSVNSSGALSVSYQGQYKEVKYNLKNNVNLSSYSSIVINASSPNGQTAVKFYDASGKEVFVQYNIKTSSAQDTTITLTSAQKANTIKTIGVMSQDTSNYSATVNSITFK
jgi:hypothetical protein